MYLRLSFRYHSGVASRRKGSPKKGAVAPSTPEPGSLLIRDLNQLKALSDPLRVRILQGFAGGSRTVREVASAIGTRQSRLYHHIAILEAAGLIEIVDTRSVRGTVEKHYRAAASRFEVDGSVFSGDEREGLEPDRVRMVSSILSQVRVEILDAQRQPGDVSVIPRPFLARMVFKGTPDEAQAFLDRIQSLFATCCRDDADKAGNDDRRDYAVTVAVCALPSSDKAN